MTGSDRTGNSCYFYSIPHSLFAMPALCLHLVPIYGGGRMMHLMTGYIISLLISMTSSTSSAYGR